MQRLPHLIIRTIPEKGRGVFTSEAIPKGSLIEICPILVLPKEQLTLIHQSALHDYYFLWGEALDMPAIALGYGSLYNHSEEPNAEWIADYSEDTMDVVACTDIPPGSEICIHYHAHDDWKEQPLWFQIKK